MDWDSEVIDELEAYIDAYLRLGNVHYLSQIYNLTIENNVKCV